MSQEKIRFSKKIIILTMAATLTYAIAYMVLCFVTGQLPDYSFNAGLFAALTAENWCNAWIKTKEYSQPVDREEQKDNLVTSDVPVQEEP